MRKRNRKISGTVLNLKADTTAFEAGLESAKQKVQTIQAAALAVPSSLKLTAACEPFELVAAADGQKKLPRTNILAYTGGQMVVEGFFRPVVIDLAGVSVPSQSIPLLRDHNPERIIGHSDGIEVSSQRIKLIGVVSGIGPDAEEVTGMAGNGFPWRASVGMSVEQREFVEAGQIVKVNGRNFPGPVIIARKTTLRETSFLAMGADVNSAASIAAKQKESGIMTFEQWVQAKSFDAATLTAEQNTALRAMYDAEQKPATQTPPPKSELNAGSTPAIAAEQDLDEIVAAHRREKDRVAQITAMVNEACTLNPAMLDTFESIGKLAIKGKWDIGRTELTLMREGRNTSPVNFSVRGEAESSAQVLEAAFCQTLWMPNLEKQFKPEVLEAADKFHKGIGLQTLLMMGAMQNGYRATPGQRITNGNLSEVLAYALPPKHMKPLMQLRASSGFTTTSLPGILGNVANKEILAGYQEEESTWREIAAVKSVSNFHAHTRYRLLDNAVYEKVGPAGEIKHGTLGEESYTSQAHTYAKMFAITREQIINDDLGAFDDLRARLGRGAAQAFNDIFWTEFMSNASTFWTTARTNYIEGATTNLGTDGVGLGLAQKAFRLMTSPAADGAKRLGGRAEILLVPPELEIIARQLFVNTNLGAGTTVANANTFAGLYRPVVSPWLSDTTITGNSTTAFFLLRNPNILSAVVVSFLNGNQTPTVESAEADFNTLGVQFRGFHDWGVDQAEYLAGVKSKGAS